LLGVCRSSGPPFQDGGIAEVVGRGRRGGGSGAHRGAGGGSRGAAGIGVPLVFHRGKQPGIDQVVEVHGALVGVAGAGRHLHAAGGGVVTQGLDGDAVTGGDDLGHLVRVDPRIAGDGRVVGRVGGQLALHRGQGVLDLLGLGVIGRVGGVVDVIIGDVDAPLEEQVGHGKADEGDDHHGHDGQWRDQRLVL